MIAACAKVAALAAVLAIVAVSVWNPQLGGPCSVGVDGPIRCPTCGLTSGMAALVRGHLVEAVRRNLLAPLVAVLCLLSTYLAAGSLCARRPILELPGALWLWRRALWLPFALVACWLSMQLFRW